MDAFLIAMTIVGGIAAIWFICEKLIAAFFGKRTVSPHDLALFSRYKALFVDNGVAEFYHGHDFVGAFREDLWRPLQEYVDNWHTAEYEYVDEKLNAAAESVYQSAYKLGGAIAKYTIPIGNGSMRSVKPDHLPPGPTPEEIKGQGRKINALRPAFVTAHRRFVRLANKRLY